MSAQQVEGAASGAVDAGYPARPLVVTQVLGEQPAGAPSRVPNPFIIVLWLLALALVGLRVFAFMWSFRNQMSGMTSPQMEELMILQQIVWALSPAAATAGFGAIAGLLFWHAATWRNRNRNRRR